MYVANAVELAEEETFQLCLGPFFLSDCSAIAVCNHLATIIPVVIIMNDDRLTHKKDYSWRVR